MKYSHGKLSKYRLMANSPDLVSSLPKTRSMSKSHFLALMQQYGGVVVKPSGGWGGMGVISVSSEDQGNYKVHYDQKKKSIHGINSTYSFVKKKIKSSPHIVQRKISLAKVKGRPFDLRVMMQRKKGSSWVLTGKLAKIAGSGYMITNIARSHGRVVPVSTAIRQSNIKDASVSSIQNRIDHISLDAAKQLQKYYRWIDTIGLDVGIDSVGKVWIIEANFMPAKSLFYKLKDKTMFRRIIGFHKKRR
ncbi:MAG: yheD 8 [Paenibacillaceae bacterium]|jgi:hypothetical protein|nr:yheD 8 [Paenibacillaceae bacterium]